MAFANLATSTAADRQMMADLMATNNTLLKQISDQGLLINRWQALAGSSHRSPAPAPVNRLTECQPLPNNTNYCWTHGWICSNPHTSQTCTSPSKGHMKEVTRKNTMNGSNRNRKRVEEGWHEGSMWKWNNLTCKKTVNKPPLHTNSPTQSYIIANTGATGHFINANTPCTNKTPTTNGVRALMPNNSSIQATHTVAIYRSPTFQTTPRRATSSHRFVIPSFQYEYFATTIVLLPSTRPESQFDTKTQMF
jgi:hypothetical protein